VLGILVAYFSNYIIGTLHLGSLEWRWQIGISAAPALLFFIMLFFIPRSPRWLAKQGGLAEAERVLDTIGKDTEDELAQIVHSLHAERAAGQERLFQTRYRLPILLAITVGMFNQLAGINSILYYVNDIFTRAGFSRVSGDLQAMVIGGTNLLFTMIAMTVIDRLGRRMLLLVGSVGTCACLFISALLLHGGRHQDLLIVPLIGYIAFFAFSQGAVIWVYISEIFPNRVHSKGQSLGSFSHWFMTAVLAWIFPILSARSVAAPFFFFSSMMVLQFVIVFFFFPETKGVSLEELQERLGIQ
jgi:sugar porter (SP) family MFS transporter